MNWPADILEKVRRLKSVARTLKDTFVGRDEAVDLLILATICHENLLLIGPPGTAKTDLIIRYTDLVEAQEFHYLLTRFTEPSELFGPLDLEAFNQGKFQIHTIGMLPHAEIAFLDEVFQGSSAILNSLLTLVNERVFHNGAVRQCVPLISLIGASNSLPDDPGLRAFADRFLLRLQVDPIADEKLSELVDIGYELELERFGQIRTEAAPRASVLVNMLKKGDLLELHRRVGAVDTSALRPNYVGLVRDLRAEGVDLTDRRIVRGLKLVAAATLMREAMEAQPEDFWPLRHIWSRPDEAEATRSVVKPYLSEGAAARGNGARPVEEILKDLDILGTQQPRVRSEVALGAHLMALNKLRREVLKDHRQDEAARKRIEDAIRTMLQQLEGNYVQAEKS